jgi:phage baseplate assembly protein gpV
MSSRRVWVTKIRRDGRTIADAKGLSGEELETEVYQTYGFSVDREGEGLLIEVQDDADNYVSLPPAGDRVAPKGSTLIYQGETEIEVKDGLVTIRVKGGSFKIDGDKITTDMDIETSGDVLAGLISLKDHKHIGVMTGGGVTGAAQ